MTWEQAWRDLFGFSAGVPAVLPAVAALICIFVVVVVPMAGLLAYLDRKVTADLQARVGPNQAGPGGVLQPFVDFVKLLQKKAVPTQNLAESVWLGVLTIALYSTVSVLPLGSFFLLVDTDMSAFIPFWAALVLALGTMLLGFHQGTVPGWFGGVRVAAQALAGAFPAMIAVLCAGIKTGGFRWTEFAAGQGASPFSWNAFDIFQFVAFIVFVVAGLVLFNAPPLDGGVSTQDINGGVGARLYGRRLSLFRLGRFYGNFLWSAMAVVMFLGAWKLPGFVYSFAGERGWALQLFELVWLLSKILLLMLTVTWIARANPRLRSDQVTDLTWKVLGPLSLGALVGTAFVVGGGVLL